METIKSMYKEMAQNYLSTKVREACCRVFYHNELNPEADCYSLYPFTNEEIASLKALREKYGKMNFLDTLKKFLTRILSMALTLKKLPVSF